MYLVKILSHFRAYLFIFPSEMQGDGFNDLFFSKSRMLMGSEFDRCAVIHIAWNVLSDEGKILVVCNIYNFVGWGWTIWTVLGSGVLCK